MREDYVSPVGFAAEPAERRKHWIARTVTLVLVAFIVWLAWTKVINAPTDDLRRPSPQQSVLPGPR